MARNLTVQHIRTSRVNLDANASLSNLNEGELYFITDEKRLAIGLSPTTYEDVTNAADLAKYLPYTGATGPVNLGENNLTVNAQIRQNEIDTLESAVMEFQPDTVYGGKSHVIENNAGTRIKAPYIVLDTANPILAIPGAETGFLLVVAGVAPNGEAQLGYMRPIPPAYLEQDTHDANVLIKAAGGGVPSTAVLLGLDITIQQDVEENTATLQFDMTIQNQTARTGTLELGMRVNGVDLYREIKVQIPANFNQLVAMTVPLQNAYSIGDTISLIARVTEQSNTAFAVSMLASPTTLAIMRFTAGSSASSGGGATIIQKVSVPILVSGWTFDGAYFRYLHLDADITGTSYVDMIPDNEGAKIITDADVLPKLVSANGQVEISALYKPKDNFTVTVNIY